MSSINVSSTTSPGVGTVDMKLEVVTLPVSDVDRAKTFYQRLGCGRTPTSSSATTSGRSS